MVSHLKHASCGTVVGFHSSEVPSGKLFLIDDTIAIEVEILESTLKLFITQWLTETLRKLIKFVRINGAIAILVELVESFFDSVIEDFEFTIMQPNEMRQDAVSAIFNVCELVGLENAWLSTEEPLVALLFQILFDLSEIILILSVLDIGVVQDWNLRVVVVIVLLHFEVVPRHVGREEESDEVESVVLLAVQELFIGRLQNFEFFRVIVVLPFLRAHDLVQELHVVVLRRVHHQDRAKVSDLVLWSFLDWVHGAHFHFLHAHHHWFIFHHFTAFVGVHLFECVQ